MKVLKKFPRDLIDRDKKYQNFLFIIKKYPQIWAHLACTERRTPLVRFTMQKYYLKYWFRLERGLWFDIFFQFSWCSRLITVKSWHWLTDFHDKMRMNGDSEVVHEHFASSINEKINDFKDNGHWSNASSVTLLVAIFLRRTWGKKEQLLNLKLGRLFVSRFPRVFYSMKLNSLSEFWTVHSFVDFDESFLAPNKDAKSSFLDSSFHVCV